MTIDCAALRDRLEALVAGRLPRSEIDAAWAHLEGCEACAAALDLAVDRETAASGIVTAVLERTSGPACGAARTRLPELTDATLDPLEATLLDSHLAGCPECRELARVLAAMARELPTLRELEPGSGFTAAVLARTHPASVTARPIDRWIGLWESLCRRPRFAMEAAWVVTVVLLIVLGGPPAIDTRASRRASEAVATPIHEGLERAGGVLGEAVQASAIPFEQIGERLGTLRRTLASRTTRDTAGDNDESSSDQGANHR